MSKSDDQSRTQTSPYQRSGSSLSSAYPPDLVQKFHQHNLSDSTDSSPTTTLSTVDDSSGTEPSPSSSPESPPPTAFPHAMHRPRTSAGDGRPFFELQKQPPPRKGRNLKNLAVNTTRQPGRPSTGTTDPQVPTLNTNNASNGIVTSTFVKPPTPSSKRKTNQLGLTLLTPGSSKFAPQDMAIAIPPTPSIGRPGLLRHFQSSPSLPLVSISGSQHDIVSSNHRRQPTLETILSPIAATPLLPQAPEEEEQNFDVPLSRELKPEAYPDGPITVYEPNIDLYLEPTAEQARDYDVIMNVAAEVRNPFLTNGELQPEDDEIRIDGGGGIQYAPKRDRPGMQAARLEANGDSSPSTPRATPLRSTFFPDSPNKVRPDPEYMHIPWEHNSDIVPDLLRLCKVIDEKVAAGSRILVHCQCGVSRSASLVVAYGLYKNPSTSVQEAYDAIKKRSKWIGPNMNLIMQLQEFRTSLMRGGVLPDDRGLSPIAPNSALSEWSPYPFTNMRAENSPRPNSNSISPVATPLTKIPTADDTATMSPGPSSAPSGLPWVLAEKSPPSGRARAISAAVKPGSAYVNPSGKIVPVVSLLKAQGEPASTMSLATAIASDPSATSTITSQEADASADDADADAATPTAGTTPPLMSPRSDEFAMAPLQPSPAVQSVDQFGLMSPTSTEFAANPFDRSSLLASLGMGCIGTTVAAESPRRSTSLRAPVSPTTEPKGVSHQFSQTSSSFLPVRPLAQQQQQRQNLTPSPRRPLRPKLSTPTLREQHQLQSIQAKVQADIAQHRNPVSGGSVTFARPATSANAYPPSSMPSFGNSGFAGPPGPDDDALMSPRATEFTQNPFALALEISSPSDGKGPEGRKMNGGQAVAGAEKQTPSVAQKGIAAQGEPVVQIVGGAPARAPSTKTRGNGLPTKTTTATAADPRSPAQKGSVPITRNIFDVL